MTCIESYLDDLRNYVLGNAWKVVNKRIFDDIVELIDVEDNYITEEEFIKVLTSVINEHNISYIIEIQKCSFEDMMYVIEDQDKSLKEYINILLQANNDNNFWNVKVDKVVDKIREYIDVASQKSLNLKSFLINMEPLIHELRKECASTPEEDTIFRGIIKCIDSREPEYIEADPFGHGCKDPESLECIDSKKELYYQIESCHIDTKYVCVDKIAKKYEIPKDKIEAMFNKIADILCKELNDDYDEDDDEDSDYNDEDE